MAVHILICTGTSVALLVAAAAVFLSIYYPADEEAQAVLSDTSGAAVSVIDGGYMLDGKGSDTALIFYPGAKVQTEAYLPILKRIADGGIDCFLLEAPMRLAILDTGAADKVTSHYSYDTWLVSGHSMGGIAAADYASKHSDIIDAVVLLAAYPNKKLPDSLSLYTIYGSEDIVLDLDAYKQAKENAPSVYREFVITGGNHAQFGNYGEQSGDGKATISRDEQQAQTTDIILDLFLPAAS